jgi:hypothetical protein
MNLFRRHFGQPHQMLHSGVNRQHPNPLKTSLNNSRLPMDVQGHAESTSELLQSESKYDACLEFTIVVTITVLRFQFR